MKSRSSLLLWTLFIFAGALVLYTATLAPGLLWGGGDFATFQTMAFLGGVEDIRGEAGIFYHPLWVILAHPFTKLPVRDVAWRANFASAVFGAVALTFVFLSAHLLTRSIPASLLAAGALAISHTFWTYAVMPKVYSLNALLLAACVYLLLLWRERNRDVYLHLAASLYGLSFLNHLVMATAAPGFLIYIALVIWRRGRPVRTLLPAFLSFALGLSPYLLLLLQAGTAPDAGGKTLAFARGLFYALSHPAALLRGIGWGSTLGLYQFPFTVLIGLIGAYFLWQRDRAAASLVTFAILGVVAFMLAATDPSAGGGCTSGTCTTTFRRMSYSHCPSPSASTPCGSDGSPAAGPGRPPWSVCPCSSPCFSMRWPRWWPAPFGQTCPISALCPDGITSPTSYLRGSTTRPGRGLLVRPFSPPFRPIASSSPTTASGPCSTTCKW